MSSVYYPMNFHGRHCPSPLMFIAIMALAALLFLAPRASFAQGYVVVDLGSLGGDSEGAFLNEQDQVAGRAFLTDNTTFHPFLWDPVHGMQDLGVLPGLPNGWGAQVNSMGQVVGTGDDGTETVLHAFLWDAVNGMRDLNPAGMDNIAASGINDLAQITGAVYLPPYRAFLHSGDGVITSADYLSPLPGGGATSGSRVNNYGQVCCQAFTSGGKWDAAIWDSVHGMQDIGTLPGGTFALPEYINDAGDVVGCGDDALGSNRAFIYSDGVMTDLGTLSGFPYGSAISVDGSGSQVVGVASSLYNDDEPRDGPMRAVLWKDGLMYDLNTLIAPDSGWVLEIAVGINDHGQISGTGYNGSHHHALLLDPIVLQSLTISPTTVVGSKTATGKVTLAAPAIVDAYVNLESQNPAAIVPSTVKILAGHTSVSFPIKTTAVATSTTGQIFAFDGVYQSASLTVRPIGVKSVSLSASSVVGGNSVSGKVTLEAPAAPGNITVSLSSSNPAIANPAVSSMTIPAGSLTGTFTVNSFPVSSNTSVTIKATANGITKGKSLTVTP